jgi:hypothetical protein
LLQKATVIAKDCRSKKIEGVNENRDVTAKVLDQLSLDARSDPATLDGLTLEDVWQLYQALYVDADDKALQDPGIARLKAVAAEYNPVATLPTN